MCSPLEEKPKAPHTYTMSYMYMFERLSLGERLLLSGKGNYMYDYTLIHSLVRLCDKYPMRYAYDVCQYSTCTTLGQKSGYQ